MSIKTEIAQWDGKSRSDISTIYTRNCKAENFLAQIASHLDQPALQKGSTWLLKHYLEDYPQMLDVSLAGKIFNNINKIDHWESKLHILQIMQHLPVNDKYRKAVEYFVRDCLTSQLKFVRAWAYSGFYHLAVQFPQYQSEAVEMFDHALVNEAAGSVKARVRQIVKMGF